MTLDRLRQTARHFYEVPLQMAGEPPVTPFWLACGKESLTALESTALRRRIAVAFVVVRMITPVVSSGAVHRRRRIGP